MHLDRPIFHALLRLSQGFKSLVTSMQWVLLPAIPGAWLAFGVLLCTAAVVTKKALQPQLHSNRPIAVFSAEFLRWWLVQRAVGLASILFADQLRGTPFLVWWFRALVRASLLEHGLPLNSLLMAGAAHSLLG